LKPGRDRPFLGHRPIISRNPLKFADHYEWLTWGEVDRQRQYIGSALHAIFKNGEVKAEDYETVGIWSQNRPGKTISHCELRTFQPICRMANHRHCMSDLQQSHRQLVRYPWQGRSW
jgi:long-chain acyl-CoA synthetase